MKKKAVIIGIVLLVLVVCVVMIALLPGKVESFSVSDYTEQIENPNFHTDKQYAAVTDARGAKKIGQEALTERFGDNDDGYWFTWPRITVSYDEENDVWLIVKGNASLFPVEGGSLYVLIRSDGTEIAIWGEK